MPPLSRANRHSLASALSELLVPWLSGYSSVDFSCKIVRVHIAIVSLNWNYGMCSAIDGNIMPVLQLSHACQLYNSYYMVVRTVRVIQRSGWG